MLGWDKEEFSSKVSALESFFLIPVGSIRGCVHLVSSDVAAEKMGAHVFRKIILTSYQTITQNGGVEEHFK